MNVLSLFDGISCGRVALERAGLPVSGYYASEIDKYAIKISQENYPDIVQLGDIRDWQNWLGSLGKIDLILAGFPCQTWSVAGKQGGDKSLFNVMLDVMKAVQAANPSVKFIIENVKMKKTFERQITSEIADALGITFKTLINSSLVSAQNRVRYYWTNFYVGQPQDKGIILADVVDDTNRYNGAAELLDGKQVTDAGQVARALGVHGYELMKRVCGTGGKSPTLNACTGGNREPKIAMMAGNGCVVYRKLTPMECERLQTLPDNYTNYVSNTQRYKAIGNGWTVDVIAHILKEGFKDEND